MALGLAGAATTPPIYPAGSTRPRITLQPVLYLRFGRGS